MINKIRNFFSSPSNESDQQSDMDPIDHSTSSNRNNSQDKRRKNSNNDNNNNNSSYIRRYLNPPPSPHSSYLLNSTKQSHHHIYLPESVIATSGSCRKFHVMKTNTFYASHPSSQHQVDSEGFIKRTCFASVNLPEDFGTIAQVLCVSNRIYLLEAGSGRVYVYDVEHSATPVGYMIKFDGVKLKVLAIRGDSYGMLYWVFDSTLNRCVLYGGDQNHYDNVGVDIPKHALNLDSALAFDPYWDQSGGITNREITHVECAYSLSFCVTNHCEIRISGQVIWCR